MTVTSESVLKTAGEDGVTTLQLEAGGAPRPVRWVTELPSGLLSAAPLVQVTCFGGEGGPFYTFLNPRVDFDCFALTRQDARALAYEVRKWFTTQAIGQIYAGASISSVQVGNEPVWTPYDNTSLRRFVWTTQAGLHTIRGAA